MGYASLCAEHLKLEATKGYMGSTGWTACKKAKMMPLTLSNLEAE